MSDRAQHQREYYNTHKDDPEWAEKNRRQRRESYFRHREKRLAEMRLWRLQVKGNKPITETTEPLTEAQSYYRRNAEEIKKKSLDYYHKNKEKILERMKANHIPTSNGNPKGRPPSAPDPVPVPVPVPKEKPLKIKRRTVKQLEKEIEIAKKVKQSLPKFEFKDASFEISFS